MKVFAVLLVALFAGIVLIQTVYPNSTPTSAQDDPSVDEPTAVAPAPADEALPPRSPQLDVDGSDIVVEPDGKLSVPDRGDGCVYKEVIRGEAEVDAEGNGARKAAEVVVLQDPSCDIFYWYVPSTGTTKALIAVGAR